MERGRDADSISFLDPSIFDDPAQADSPLSGSIHQRHPHHTHYQQSQQPSLSSPFAADSSDRGSCGPNLQVRVEASSISPQQSLRGHKGKKSIGLRQASVQPHIQIQQPKAQHEQQRQQLQQQCLKFQQPLHLPAHWSGATPRYLARASLHGDRNASGFDSSGSSNDSSGYSNTDGGGSRDSSLLASVSSGEYRNTSLTTGSNSSSSSGNSGSSMDSISSSSNSSSSQGDSDVRGSKR